MSKVNFCVILRMSLEDEPQQVVSKVLRPVVSTIIRSTFLSGIRDGMLSSSTAKRLLDYRSLLDLILLSPGLNISSKSAKTAFNFFCGRYWAVYVHKLSRNFALAGRGIGR